MILLRGRSASGRCTDLEAGGEVELDVQAFREPLEFSKGGRDFRVERLQGGVVVTSRKKPRSREVSRIVRDEQGRAEAIVKKQF